MEASMPVRPLTSKEATLVKKRKQINNLLLQPGGSQRSFVAETDSKELWILKDIEKLFPELTRTQQKTAFIEFRVVLTILVRIAWPFDSGVFDRNFLQGNARRTDEDLPLDNELGFLDAYEYPFMQTQMTFKPCLITPGKNMSTIKYPAQRPWPFLESERISQGSGGEISKVVIAPRYYCNGDGLSNEGPQVLAYKRFLKAADLEISNQEILRRSISGHTHVQLHVAAILHGTEFYIFLPWTPLGDLEVLLHGGHDPAAKETTLGTAKYEFEDEFHGASENHFIGQLTKLASALRYLHHELVLSDTSEQYVRFYCSHSDFRPRNILVYPSDENSPCGRWVIADFGISSFGTPETGSDDLPQLFGYPTVGNLALGARNGLQKRVGTHIAPELNDRSFRIPDPRKCDIWSFGAVSTDVLAFVLGGMWHGIDFNVVKAVRSLKSFRANKTGDEDDYFYQFTADTDGVEHDGTTEDAALRDEVSEWLADQDAKYRSAHGFTWVTELVALLREMLTVDPKLRIDASAVCDRLEKIVKGMPKSSVSRLSEYIRPSPQPPPELYTGADSMTSASSRPTRTSSPLESPSLAPFNIPNAVLSPSQFANTNWEGSPTSAASLSPSVSHRRGKSADSSITPSSQRSRETKSSTDSKSIRSGQSRGKLDVRRPVLADLIADGDVKRCAVSPAADQVAWLVKKPGSHRLEPPTWVVKVFATAASQYSCISLPPLPTHIAWENASTSLKIASDLVTISGLNRDRTNEAFWIICDRSVWQTASLPDPCAERSPNILPSVGGKFALYTRSGGLIQLRDVHSASWRPKLHRPGCRLNTCCFTADGQTLISWWWSAGKSGQIKHEIIFWSINNATKPEKYTFVVDAKRTDGQGSILPAASQAACMYRFDESSPYRYLKASWEPGNSIRAAEIPKCPVYNSLPTACEDYWRVAITQKTKVFRKEFEIREARYEGNGIFGTHSELLLSGLTHNNYCLAARDIGAEQRIVLASEQGELIVVSIPWQAGSAV